MCFIIIEIVKQTFSKRCTEEPSYLCGHCQISFFEESDLMKHFYINQDVKHSKAHVDSGPKSLALLHCDDEFQTTNCKSTTIENILSNVGKLIRPTEFIVLFICIFFHFATIHMVSKS